MSALTPGEKEVLEHLVKAWNAFMLLPQEHPDGVHEFRHGIHHAQALILMRPTMRGLAG